MTKEEPGCIPIERDLVKVEVALVSEVREREDRPSVRRPVDDVMDPVPPVRERARLTPVDAHDPDDPALVAALIRAVCHVRAVRGEPVRANAVGLVRKADGRAGFDGDAPELNRAGEVAHVVEGRPVRREGEPRRAARVEDPCQRWGQGPSVARVGGECGAVGGRVLAAVAVLALLACGCAPGGGIAGAPTPSAAAPAISETVIQSGLVVPWDVAVAGDGPLFVDPPPARRTACSGTPQQ